MVYGIKDKTKEYDSALRKAGNEGARELFKGSPMEKPVAPQKGVSGLFPNKK